MMLKPWERKMKKGSHGGSEGGGERLERGQAKAVGVRRRENELRTTTRRLLAEWLSPNFFCQLHFSLRLWKQQSWSQAAQLSLI